MCLSGRSCANNWQLQIAVFINTEYVFRVIYSFTVHLKDHCLISEGRIFCNKFKAGIYNFKSQKGNQFFTKYFCICWFWQHTLFGTSSHPLKNGLIFVDAVNSHWAERTGWSKGAPAKAVKCSVTLSSGFFSSLMIVRLFNINGSYNKGISQEWILEISAFLFFFFKKDIE